jgi:hypothetical protein
MQVGGSLEEREASEERTAVLVGKATSALLSSLKVGDSQRLAAFAKRLCASALHAEPALGLPLLSIANRYDLFEQ